MSLAALLRAFLFISLLFENGQGCIPMWDPIFETNSMSPSTMCPVTTTSGSPCIFPYTFGGVTYKTCTIWGPNNPYNRPQCAISVDGNNIARSWSFCQVPTDAVVSYVTVRKGGDLSEKVGSIQGGTMLWIYGMRFLPNAFTSVPSSATNNAVQLVDGYSVYDCQMHNDKTTPKQLTCYTPALPDSSYQVRVYVNGYLIPLYQYFDISRALFFPSWSQTPTINSIVPSTGPPQSFFQLSGSFKTACYSRDVDGCSQDNTPLISRIYIGGHLCNLVDPTNNSAYSIVSDTSLQCLFDGNEVGVFNISMLVSNGYGRSWADPNLYRVSAREDLYHIQTYAVITNTTPSIGSTAGGTTLTITGNFFSDSPQYPLEVNVGGQPCTILDSNTTTIHCQTPPMPSSIRNLYAGGRGLEIFRMLGVINQSSLISSNPPIPPVNITPVWTDDALYVSNSSVAETVWLIGFVRVAKNSAYTFMLDTNADAAVLFLSTDDNPANKILITQLNNQSSTISLQNNTNYYLLCIGTRANGNLRLGIQARMYQTRLSASTSAWVKNEIQKIDVISNITLETQEFIYSVNVTNGTGEVQSLEVSFSTFQIGFRGVYTAIQMGRPTAVALRSALNDIPTIHPLSVSVNEINGLYMITFPPEMGDVPLLTCISDSSNAPNVTEVIKGIPSGSKIAFSLDNQFTDYIDVTSNVMTQAQLYSIFSNLFSIQCPPSMYDPSVTPTIVYTQDFESNCVYDTTPMTTRAFCGLCSSQSNVLVSRNGVIAPILCFAYRILNQFVVSIGVGIQVNGDTSATFPYNIPFKPVADQNWHYTCVDVRAALMAQGSINRAIQRVLIQSAWLNYNIKDGIFVDTVSVRTAFPDGYEPSNTYSIDQSVNNSCVFPFYLNGNRYSACTLDNNDLPICADQFNQTYTCVSSSIEGVRRYYPKHQLVYNSLQVSYIPQNFTIRISFRYSDCQQPNEFIGWPLNSTIVTTLSNASDIVNGTFDLIFNNRIYPSIAVDISTKDLTNLLQASVDFDFLNIQRTGHCTGYKYTIEWNSSSGSKDLMIINNTDTITPNGTSVIASRIQTGSVLINPLSGDCTRTYRTNPQIEVIVGGYPTQCIGKNTCDFQWSSSQTPTVTSVSQSGQTLTISGTGFNPINSSNTVIIGTSGRCTVTVATVALLVCTISAAPSGTQSVQVNVNDKGLATSASVFTATVSLQVTGISPMQGGAGGGYQLNITGSGFSTSSVVTVGNRVCLDPIVSNFNLITCTVPYSTVIVSTPVSIMVTDGSNLAVAPNQFTYDVTNVPTITSYSPTFVTMSGGIINITGTNFGNTLAIVSIGTTKVAVLSTTPNQILATLPTLTPGLHSIRVLTSNGYARPWISIEYRFYIQSVSPQVGSLYGGTDVYVQGEGFDDSTTVSFTDGSDTIPCPVISFQSNQIHCQTMAAAPQQIISANGIHPNYGVGFAWSPQYATVQQGAAVQWQWGSSSLLTDLSYKVQQVADGKSMTTIPGGFDSGDATASGIFTYQFQSLGTYHYLSPSVDKSGSIDMRGIIQVVPAQPRTLTINVVSGSYKAQSCAFPFIFNSITYTNCTSINDTQLWCSPTSTYTGQRLYCSPTNTIPTPSCLSSSLINPNVCSQTIPTNPLQFLFTPCTMGTVTSISPVLGPAGTLITIHGTGFSTHMCDNIVMIGSSYQCSIQNISSIEIICQIGWNSSLSAATPYSIVVRRNRQGDHSNVGLIQYQFQAQITGISLQQGSIAGGTLIVIDGDGFNPDETRIMIGYIEYTPLANITYTQIRFTTTVPPSSYVNQPISFKVVVGSNPAVCNLNACTFTWARSITPYFVSVNATTIQGPQTLTLSGRNLAPVGPVPLSNIHIDIGGQSCNVTSALNATIVCQIGALPVGNYSIRGSIEGIGNIVSSLFITSMAVISSASPLIGSIYGGIVLSIMGNGFPRSISTLQVSVGNVRCPIIQTTPDQIQCLVPARTSTSSIAAIQVISNGLIFPGSIDYIYSVGITPIITSISPTFGAAGQTLTISGSNFVSGQSTVSIGGSSCTIVSISTTVIVCTVASSPAGNQSVIVKVDNVGLSNANIQYQYALRLQSVSPVQGSFGGGQVITIIGDGFNTSALSVIIDNQPCQSIQILSNTQLTCQTPPSNFSLTDRFVSLSVIVGDLMQNLTYIYQTGITARINSISPTRGGTGGGTVVTINGTNFINGSIVTIANVPCTIQSLTTNTITCLTGIYSGSSIQATVIVSCNNNGIAVGSSQYHYMDLWSSPWTWGGYPPPEEGTLVMIDNGKTIYFDTTTPILKAILIDNATLIFDDNQDVALNAEYIVIINGGRLQIGTESNPFQHRAVITMYGHLRSIELPIFGSKVLALREGVIDMHGSPTVRTWTRLSNTANAGANNITLLENVDWSVGSEIIIATTNDANSQRESEKRTITAVSSDERTLTLNSPLVYTHLGVTRTVGSVTIEARAEVGLLSHNIVFQGSYESSWLETIQSCPNGFSPDEFAVQTCFLGRYGEEMGSDEFGATIMASGTNDNSDGIQRVILRLSNIEVTNAGQAFRLGRYPVHFHMNGNMSQSYIKSSSIHYTFNRAVNIHASHYVTVENNVIYNIMGGAMFLEDGVEIGNVFRQNLAIFVRSSSSLINEDVTPAAFWVTNPNNTLEHNAVAGGTHFGYWYRMLASPDGPSFSMYSGVCPDKQPFGRFFNNSVHSCGRFGVWIFPEYEPSVGGDCWNIIPTQAVFDRVIAWRNGRGFEWVMARNIQVRNSLVFDNAETGIRCTTAIGHQEFNNYPIRNTYYNETTGSSVIDSIIIGDSGIPGTPIVPGEGGLVVMWDRGLRVRNVSFINFPYSGTQAIFGPVIIGRCSYNDGGWLTKFSQISFTNVLNRGRFRWQYDGLYDDEDGSLGGIPNSIILPFDGLWDNGSSACIPTPNFVDAMTCPRSIGNWIRLSFSNAYLGRNGEYLNIYNALNRHNIIFKQEKRLTHPRGYMTTLLARQTYLFQFQNTISAINMSFVGIAYDVQPGDYLIISHNVSYLPDQVFTISGYGLRPRSPLPLGPSNNNGDWHYDNNTRIFSFILINPSSNAEPIDIPVGLYVIKCRFPNCVPPAQPGLELPATARPSDCLYWANDDDWEFAIDGYSVNVSRKPPENSNVFIPRGVWMVINYPLPRLRALRIDGVLEFEQNMNNTLEVDSILINGGQLIAGWPYNPLRSRVDIVIRGSILDDVQLPNGAGTIGSRTIGVFGGLDLHGLQHNVTWTRLATTASTGQNVITLMEAVDWSIGDEILLTTTDTRIDHVERHTIASITGGGTIINLVNQLKYTHIVIDQTFPNGQQFRVAGAVGLLTRNVRVINRSPASELYGFRILVTDYGTNIWDPLGSNYIYTYYKGYARLSNTQFIGYGQYVNSGESDKRSGIFLSNLGDWNSSRPSFIDSCSFDTGYFTTIAISDSNGIPIKNNLLYWAYESAILVNGKNNIIQKNLISTVFWSGSAKPEMAEFNTNNDGAVMTSEAISVIMKDNLVSGVDRLAFRIQGNACPGVQVPIDVFNDYDNNEVHSAMAGVNIWSYDPGFLYDKSCILIKGFKTYKAYHYGFYINNPRNIIIDSSIAADSNVGIFTFVVAPPAKYHFAVERSITIRNSLVIGAITPNDCNDYRDRSTTSAREADKAVPNVANTDSYTREPLSRVGLSFPYFSLDNMVPRHQYTSVAAYPAIMGVMYVTNVTFAFFNDQCGRHDSAIRVSQQNNDGQHPVITSQISVYNSSQENLIFNGRPNLGVVNLRGCIDMDCDGLKKGLLTDTDGSFFGQPSSIFSQAEYNWGNQAHGVGDFRIPRVAMTNLTGQKFNISALYPYRGIVRAPSCVYQPAWQMYYCPNVTDYRMLIIESMDGDSETRRLSPVAVMSNGYIDLINGPQDHGCCNGYACLKRLSTFMAIVRARQHADIYLSSTTPNHMRFRLLNADSSIVTTLSLYYNSLQQIDVYANGVYIRPVNQDPAFSTLMLMDVPNSITFNSPAGSNYFNRTHQMAMFVIDGTTWIELKISELIILTFGLPPETPTSFFQGNVLANMANLLGVAPSKIRRINIITGSGNVRVRRQLATIQIRVEIREEPVPILSMNNGTVAQSTMNMNSMIINAYQSGVLHERWRNHVDTNGTVPLSLTIQEPRNDTTVELNIIHHLSLIMPPSSCRERSPCDVQPILVAYDVNGQIIDKLGSNDQPWQIVASVVGQPNVGVIGAIANYSQGQSQYRTFGVTQLGNYQIEFRFLTPNGLTNAFVFNTSLTANTSTIRITNAILAARQYGYVDVVSINQTFNVSIVLVDKISKIPLPNIQWNSFNWSATVSLYDLGTYNRNGSLLITSSSAIVIDTTSGIMTATNLAINKIGMYIINVQVTSSNNQYMMNTTSNGILVKNSTTTLLVDPGFPTSYITFIGNYYEVQAREQLEFLRTTTYNYLLQIRMPIASDIVLWPSEDITSITGGIIAAFVPANGGPPTDLRSAVNHLISSDNDGINGFQVSSVMINDRSYDGSSASANSNSGSSNGNGSNNNTGLIVGLVLGLVGAAILVTVSIVSYQKFQAKKKGARLFHEPIESTPPSSANDPPSVHPSLSTAPEQQRLGSPSAISVSMIDQINPKQTTSTVTAMPPVQLISFD